MKKTIMSIVLLLSGLLLYSQTNKPLWPIRGGQPGEQIIMAPDDQVYNEFRKINEPFNAYLIGAPEGRAVVAITDGVIVSVSYGINFSYIYSYGSSIYDEITSLLKRKKLSIPERYIHSKVSLKLASGHVVHYSGLLAPAGVELKTGRKVKQGDLLGHVGYYYYKIERPGISISVDLNGKVGDIKAFMTGAKMAEPKKSAEELLDYGSYLHPVVELKKSFNIFKESIIEGHPGLYDYITEPELARIFAEIEKGLTEPMTSDSFYLRLMPVIRALGDSHTYIIRNYTMKKELTYKGRGYFPIRMSYINGKLLITEPGEAAELRKGFEIKTIDGRPAAEIIESLKQLCGKGDGLITTWTEFQLQQELPFTASGVGALYILQKKLKIGDKVKLELVDSGGERKEVTLELGDSRPKVNGPVKKYVPYELKELEGNIGYLALNTMWLSETELEEIQKFIKEQGRKGTENLIIDLRRNFGGASESPGFIYSLLANKSFRLAEYIKVNKNSPYELFKHSSNFAPGENITGEYKSIRGKEGYYLNESATNYELQTIKPHPDRFKGTLYLLTGKGTGSAAVSLAALVYRQRRGTIIGSEGHNGYYKMNALKFASIPLPGTGLTLNLPLMQTVFQSRKERGIPRGRGVIPHYRVEPTLDSITGESDPELELCLQLIKKSR